MTKEGYCCDAFDQSIEKGIIKQVNFSSNLDHMFDTYYIESVIKKDTKRFLYIWENLIIDTEDLILRYCPFCGVEL